MSDQEQVRLLMEELYGLVRLSDKQRNKPVSIAGSIPVSKSSLNLLMFVGDHPKERMTDVAEQMSLSKGTISQLASRLEAEGLLAKIPGTGRSRDIYLTLTDEGQRIFQESSRIGTLMQDDIRETLSHLRDEDIVRLRGLTERLHDLVYASELLPSDN